jgi:hypothetical protein
MCVGSTLHVDAEGVLEIADEFLDDRIASCDVSLYSVGYIIVSSFVTYLYVRIGNNARKRSFKLLFVTVIPSTAVGRYNRSGSLLKESDNSKLRSIAPSSS